MSQNSALSMQQEVIQSLDHGIATWRDAEVRYESNLYYGSSTVNGIRVVKNEESPWIITAPHSVNHVREGALKYADRGTGGLADSLAESFDCSAVIADGRQEGDPNWDQEAGPFKKTLLSLLGPTRFVLDLHGMKDSYDIDINIGLGPAPSERVQEVAVHFRSSFQRVGLSVAIDWPFDGRRLGTVTSFVQHSGYSGLQLEIAASLRNPSSAPKKATRLLTGFLVALHDIRS